MPPGIPVATVALGKAGAKNAGILAAQILAGRDPGIAKKLVTHRKTMAADIAKKAGAIKKRRDSNS